MIIKENVPLKGHTTFKIGGPARYFVALKNETELSEALGFAREKSLPVFILGGGSNLVVSDAGFAGLVIKMEMAGASCEKQGDDFIVTAWAGENWDVLVGKTVEWGAWGLENLSAIPGTVGAAPVQNIGAYGTEVKNTVESVRAVDRETGAARSFSNAECRFAYRDSCFKSPEGKKWIIVSVTFRLSAIPKPNLSYRDLKEYFAGKSDPTQSEIRDAVAKIRASKFPDLAEFGTAGSFWKNPIISRDAFEALRARYPDIPSFPAQAPAGSREVAAHEAEVKIPLAWILDKICGLNGYRSGHVGLFKKQPLVVVAEEGATAEELARFETDIRSKVETATGIKIEPEAVFV
ncbi:MAG TPA: UDP-N-acetylmuramate dehydrogenase [Candidatus Paceibacterota bacterium]|nr:UDP-N-acetylmuramate dehydrogenase [Candidatus Paceibacterota bacterium]